MMRSGEIGGLTEVAKTWNPQKTGLAGAFRYIDIGSIDHQTKTISGVTELSYAEAPSRARQLVQTGDVLVSTVRPNLNAVAVVPEELDGATASTGFCVLRPTSELISRYLFHWVRSPEFIRGMTARATGQSYPAISDKIVRGSHIPLPGSVDEQRAAAAILDQADSLLEKRRQANLLLDGLAQSIFLDMFGDPRSNRCGFPKKEVKELVPTGDRINYGVVQPGDEFDGGVPLIRVGDLTGGQVRHDAIKKISPLIEVNYRRSRIKGNEILVGCVGSVGAVALSSKREIGFNVARAVARIPIESSSVRRYVAEYLRTPYVQEYFHSQLRTVAQPTLNIKQLSETVILVPPSDLMDTFGERLDFTDQVRSSSMRQLQELDQLTASLHDKAFCGEL